MAISRIVARTTEELTSPGKYSLVEISQPQWTCPQDELQYVLSGLRPGSHLHHKNLRDREIIRKLCLKQETR